MQSCFVISIRDIDPLVSSNGVRVNGLSGRNAVLPLLLHLGVHNKERIVGEMDGDLSFCIGFFFGSVFLGGVVIFQGDDASNSKFSCYSKRDAADYCSGA